MVKSLFKDDITKQGVSYIFDQKLKVQRKEKLKKDSVKEYVDNFGSTVETQRNDSLGQRLLQKISESFAMKVKTELVKTNMKG